MSICVRRQSIIDRSIASGKKGIGAIPIIISELHRNMLVMVEVAFSQKSAILPAGRSHTQSRGQMVGLEINVEVVVVVVLQE